MSSASSFQDDALPPEHRFLAGGGAATRLILQRDWTDHWLGPPEGWPEALKAALSLVLNSPESMILMWGREELTFFFNETYFPLLGPRLPWAMGAPFAEVWADGLEQARPIIADAFAGRSKRFIDLPWRLNTDRGARDTWWTFSYSRVLGADGEIAGLFIFTNETTARVLADAAAKESQEKLRLETERQRLSLQQMPGFAAILAGPDQIFEYVNDAYVSIFGARDFIGRSVREIFPDIEGQGYHELLDRVYATGQPFSGQALPLRLRGETVEQFIDLLFQPIRDGAGDVTGIFIGGYDITDRVRGERRREALFKLDERLRDAADTAELSFYASELLGQTLGVIRVGYGALDSRAGTIAVERDWRAPGYASVAGTHHFSTYGSHVDELRQGRDVINHDVMKDARTLASIDAFKHFGVAAHLDIPVVERGVAVAEIFVHSNVPRHWTDDEVALVRDFAERTQAAIARRRAEQDLRESELRYRTLFDSIDEGFCVIEFLDGPEGPASDYVHVQANPAYTRHAGIPGIVGKRLREIVTSREADAWAEIYRRVLITGEPIRFERELTETVRHLDLAAFRIDPSTRRQVAVLFRDITIRKRAEAALRDLNETLERRVAQEVAERMQAEETLRQTQKIEAIGQLTGGVAHDFNNLLAAILSNLDLARKSVSEPRTARLVDGAIMAAERGASLTSRLLAFARRQDLKSEAVDAFKLAEGMRELLERTLGATISLAIEVPAGLPLIEVDPNQLELALLNLAVNARDAMPEGGRLVITAAPETIDEQGQHAGLVRPGPYVRLTVRDDGAGMDEATLKRATEPFFTTKGVGKGTGLGLSMVQGLVVQLGGGMKVESAPGDGTTVTLWLPKALAGGPVETISEPASRGPIVTERGFTVLVVDDDALVGMGTAAMLEDLGYSVLEAGSAKAAIALFEAHPEIDIVVTDHAMPGMTGLALAEALQARRPALPVILASGYAELPHGQTTSLPRLAKPFRQEELETAIMAVVCTRS